MDRIDDAVSTPVQRVLGHAHEGIAHPFKGGYFLRRAHEGMDNYCTSVVNWIKTRTKLYFS